MYVQLLLLLVPRLISSPSMHVLAYLAPWPARKRLECSSSRSVVLSGLDRGKGIYCAHCCCRRRRRPPVGIVVTAPLIGKVAQVSVGMCGCRLRDVSIVH